MSIDPLAGDPQPQHAREIILCVALLGAEHPHCP